MNEQDMNPRTVLIAAAIGAVVCFLLAILIYLFAFGKEPMVPVYTDDFDAVPLDSYAQ